MDESDAAEALEDLGLTNYEVQVFIALQKLGTGSASDVDRITSVPRSQVYGAAEKLEERGLVEIQQSTPIRYRPVPLEEARERLRNRYEQRESRAFEYLEDVRSSRTDTDEHQEDVWTLHGHDSVTARTVQLIEEADDEILYAGDEAVVSEAVATALSERAEQDVAVTVLSGAPSVLDRFADATGVGTVSVPAELTPEDARTGRVLIVDGDTVLLSILGDVHASEPRSETAIWSSDTGFAAVLIRLLTAWLDGHLE